jgi:L-threonylcarbamoyladenylate synthase
MILNQELITLYPMAEIGQDIEKAKYYLEQGELVAIPTETVYGLAANALNDRAVAKIFEAKNRPSFDPLIVHIANMDALNLYSQSLDPRLKALALHFWPGPLTLLTQKQTIISDLVTSGLDQIALRIPAHPLTQKLLNSLVFPLAAPSANPFGYISPTSAEHVAAQLGDKIKYILDGGPSAVGLESTICGIADNKPTIYRLGGLSIEAIENWSQLNWDLQINVSSNPIAPGTLKSHYAPKTQLIQGDIDQLFQLIQPQKFGIIALKKQYDFSEKQCAQIQLSTTGDLQIAATHLFSSMRSLDTKNLDVIFCEIFPEEGLGRAINDRLKRASA